MTKYIDVGWVVVWRDNENVWLFTASGSWLDCLIIACNYYGETIGSIPMDYSEACQTLYKNGYRCKRIGIEHDQIY